MTSPTLPFDETDMRRIEERAELARLRDEVTGLRKVADAARYASGPRGCFDPEDDVTCPEYFTDDTLMERNDVQWCSHVERHHATFADVAAREMLEDLIEEVLADSPEEVAERLLEGVYAIVCHLENTVDGGETITARSLYQQAVAAARMDAAGAVPPPDLPGFTEIYGVKVCVLGEDGNLVALGHHEPKRALAAFARYSRVYLDRLETDPGERLTDRIIRMWATNQAQCDEGDCGGRCEICTSDWWLTWGKTPTPGAFPITVFEVA